jgi:hypothetical protein
MASIASKSSPQPEPIKTKPAVQVTGDKKKDIDWSFIWIIIILGILILSAILS